MGVDVQVIQARVSLGGLARDEAVALVRVLGVATLFVLVEGAVVAHRHGGRANERDGGVGERLAERGPGDFAIRFALDLGLHRHSGDAVEVAVGVHC